MVTGKVIIKGKLHSILCEPSNMKLISWFTWMCDMNSVNENQNKIWRRGTPLNMIKGMTWVETLISIFVFK